MPRYRMNLPILRNVLPKHCIPLDRLERDPRILTITLDELTPVGVFRLGQIRKIRPTAGTIASQKHVKRR